ncbi:MAG: hypothetical protein SGBAC_007260 [Bacillariaceae sp.]
MASVELHQPIITKRFKLDSGAIPTVRRNPCLTKEWVESGYSLSQAKLLQDEEDASPEGVGSGTTEEGKRFSRHVAN